jgi:predicted AlkP superfamily phosphohydrolase/phosphomutase
MTGPRVLLLALDAAEPTLLRRFASEGHMPALQHLMSEGRTATLESAAAEFPDEVWPSIYCSSNAAAIGKYYYIQPQPGSGRLELLDDELRGESFWELLSRAGRRSAIVDVPKAALGAPINGLQLVNWGAHATRCARASHPPGLMDELRREVGEYPVHSCDNHGRSPRAYRRLRDRLLAGVRQRGRLLRRLLAREDWDLFFGAFSETHCAGHHFWHFQDPRHPLHDPRDRHGLASAIRDIYRAVDDEVGRLTALAGPDSHVIVFSSHGMAPQFHGRDLIPALLDLWGLSGPPVPGRAAGRGEARVEVRPDLVQRLKDRVPMALQYYVKARLPARLERTAICRVMGSKALDPRAQVRQVPSNDLNPAFRVSLRGRDENGVVEPGAELESILAFLEARLRELVNPATGAPAIRSISRPRDTHKGAHAAILPDLCAMWAGDAWIGELHSPGYGSVAGDHHDLRTGGHDTTGLITMRTPGFVDESRGAPPNAKDLGPTVLALLSVDVPDWMEGRSLVALQKVPVPSSEPCPI